MAIPALVGSSLPLGRWHCELSEFEARFVTGKSPARNEIWKHWKDLTSVLRSAVGHVAACWIAGSFVSDKVDPADIDCVYVIDSQLINAALANTQVAQFLTLVAGSRLKAQGIRVDSYILPWDPPPGVRVTSPTESEYVWRRGYWDDLWGRQRDADPRMGSLPRRGYLEVNLDGYR